MQVNGIAVGARLLLEDGSVVQVMRPSSDGVTVHVRYLEAPFDEALIGTEGDCTDYDIVAYTGETEVDSAKPPGG
jgi:hypothetical protein